EVRFRDPGHIRGLVVSALKDALGRAGFRSATTGGARTLEALRPAFAPPPRPGPVAARVPPARPAPALAASPAPHDVATLERPAAGIARQLLLIPEVVDLDPVDAGRVLAEAETLEALGLVVEGFGEGAVLVREVPAALAGGRIKALVQDVADALAEWGAATPV